MKKIILFNLIISHLFISQIANAQADIAVLKVATITEETLINKGLESTERAAIYIQNLKENGALLVRLTSRKRSLEKYRAFKQHAIARNIEQRQRKLNLQLVTLLRAHFDFCPIYFFYDYDSPKILNKEFTKVFLNDQLELDENIKLIQSFFLTAEVGPVRETKPDQPKADENYHINRGNLSEAFVIKDANFTQLKSPFPFWVKASFKKFLHRKIKKINKKLHSFYLQTKR